MKEIIQVSISIQSSNTISFPLDTEVHSSREFNLFTKEQTITPMKQTPVTTRSSE